jgi:hypothetical protein
MWSENERGALLYSHKREKVKTDLCLYDNLYTTLFRKSFSHQISLDKREGTGVSYQ